MKMFLAGVGSRPYVITNLKENLLINKEMGYNMQDICILESYYYLRNDTKLMSLVKECSTFLLDSGAFTFLSGKTKKECDWDNYVEEYAAFINRYDVKLFFELDIDCIVGLKEVERLREKLELLTCKKCIPVWHRNRGKEYFIEMCKNYSFVALGGIVTQEIPRNTYEKVFPWFINKAHEYKTKIHGLGYTVISGLKKYRFDSVDSTSWVYGNIGGFVYRFNQRKGIMEKIKKPKHRLKNVEAASHNFKEWVKYGIYIQNNY